VTKIRKKTVKTFFYIYGSTMYRLSLVHTSDNVAKNRDNVAKKGDIVAETGDIVAETGNILCFWQQCCRFRRQCRGFWRQCRRFWLHYRWCGRGFRLRVPNSVAPCKILRLQRKLDPQTLHSVYRRHRFSAAGMICFITRQKSTIIRGLYRQLSCKRSDS